MGGGAGGGGGVQALLPASQSPFPAYSYRVCLPLFKLTAPSLLTSVSMLTAPSLLAAIYANSY